MSRKGNVMGHEYFVRHVLLERKSHAGFGISAYPRRCYFSDANLRERDTWARTKCRNRRRIESQNNFRRNRRGAGMPILIRQETFMRLNWEGRDWLRPCCANPPAMHCRNNNHCFNATRLMNSVSRPHVSIEHQVRERELRFLVSVVRGPRSKTGGYANAGAQISPTSPYYFLLFLKILLLDWIFMWLRHFQCLVYRLPPMYCDPRTKLLKT